MCYLDYVYLLCSVPRFLVWFRIAGSFFFQRKCYEKHLCLQFADWITQWIMLCCVIRLNWFRTTSKKNNILRKPPIPIWKGSNLLHPICCVIVCKDAPGACWARPRAGSTPPQSAPRRRLLSHPRPVFCLQRCTNTLSPSPSRGNPAHGRVRFPAPSCIDLPVQVMAVHTQLPHAHTQLLHSTWVSAPSS